MVQGAHYTVWLLYPLRMRKMRDPVSCSRRRHETVVRINKMRCHFTKQKSYVKWVVAVVKALSNYEIGDKMRCIRTWVVNLCHSYSPECEKYKGLHITRHKYWCACLTNRPGACLQPLLYTFEPMRQVFACTSGLYAHGPPWFRI